MLRYCILLAVFCAGANSDEKCFANLGCFSTDKPWHTEIIRDVPPPEDPKDLDISLNFYSRSNRKKSEKVNVFPDVKLNRGYLPQREKTIFIIPALGSSPQWPMELKNALLKRIDCNVFHVNVSGAFHGINQFQAVSNARVVGAVLGKVVKTMIESKGQDPKKIWVIGHGLGAQTAGYVGKIRKIGRITGLDPMQNLFEGSAPEVHLTSSDADYVDVLHTDARPNIPDLGLGYISPIGTVDFYFNGGHGQPGCKLPRPSSLKTTGTAADFIKQITKVTVSAVYCAHKRSFKYFIESIDEPNCIFWGHPNTKENFLRAISNVGTEGVLTRFTALSAPCDVSKCVPLGLDSPKSKLRGLFIVTTNGDKPYCAPSKSESAISMQEKKKEGLEQWVHGLIGTNKQ